MREAGAHESGAKGEAMNRLWESWQDGGWGMWPVLVFGILGVFGAARFAWRGEHSLTGFVRWMLATTSSSALLGFTSGMQAVFNAIVGHDPRIEYPTAAAEAAEWRIKILFEGTREASNCLSFGLIMTTLTCLLLAIGYRRSPAPDAA
jgi:hypothetical protein